MRVRHVESSRLDHMQGGVISVGIELTQQEINCLAEPEMQAALEQARQRSQDSGDPVEFLRFFADMLASVREHIAEAREAREERELLMGSDDTVQRSSRQEDPGSVAVNVPDRYDAARALGMRFHGVETGRLSSSRTSERDPVPTLGDQRTIDDTDANGNPIRVREQWNGSYWQTVSRTTVMFKEPEAMQGGISPVKRKIEL